MLQYTREDFDSRTFHAGQISVTVLSRRECLAFYSNLRTSSMAPSPVVIVSITSPGHNVPAFSKTLVPMSTRLKFEDVLGNDERAMTREQASDIVTFSKSAIKSGITNIVVHCDGGVSRSAGIASALLDVFGKSHDEGNAVWRDARFFPNEWCYRLVREAGGLVTSDETVEERIRENIMAYNEGDG